MNPTEHARLHTFEETLLSARRTMVLSEILRLAVDSFRSSKIRFALTALGMVIGTASVILVVTIGLTGKQFILQELQKLETNSVELEYNGGGAVGSEHTAFNDYLTREDEKAVLAQLPSVMYSSPVMQMHAPISYGRGVVKDTLVLGVSPQYQQIRNLLVPVGRFLDDTDDSAHIKCAVVTEKFAHDRFGGADSAVGQSFEISGIPFTIVGVFKESVDDYGVSEIQDQTILIPYSVARYFTGTENVKPDLLFHAQHGRGDGSRQRDQAHRPGAPPARLRLFDADPQGGPDDGRQGCRHPDRGAVSGFRRHADGGRSGHHEHHAGHMCGPAPARSASARRWAPLTGRSSTSFWPRRSSSR